MEDRRCAGMLYGISGIILLVGLSSAFLIYRAAENESPGYEEGTTFSPEYSKQNLRELELYGGEANVLGYEFRLWFAGLWHGKSLAFIVAGATILLSVGCFYAADHPP
jgi:hypothetical protein